MFLRTKFLFAGFSTTVLISTSFAFPDFLSKTLALFTLSETSLGYPPLVRRSLWEGSPIFVNVGRLPKL